MDAMDLKGIAWVGHTYLKFEEMCLEAQGAMCEETLKYVENHVQTMSASMKRFCSDILHDFLPPSSRDGIHEKPISSIKQDSINIDPLCIKRISENKSNSNDDGLKDWSAISYNWDIIDNDEANDDLISMQVSYKTHDATVGHLHKETCESSGLVSEMSSQATSSTSNPESVSHTAVCNPDLEVETENNTSMRMMEPIGHESKSGFEETCVLVDGNDYVLDHHIEEIRRPYKKKIQMAFSLKKRSARKQEYKQLAALVIEEEKAKCEEATLESQVEAEWELI